MYIEINRFAFLRIARHDITCYKVLENIYGILSDIDTGFIYTPGKSYFANIKRIGKTWGTKCRSGDIGLHSDVEKTTLYSYPRAYDQVLVECTIPKGAHYYKGIQVDTERYVSDTLIINKIVDMQHGEIN